MKKIASQNMITVLTLCLVYYAAYILLLEDNCLHVSISDILAKTHHLELREHLIVLGLLPIYIASVIFGSTIFALHLASWVRKFLCRPMNE